MPHNILRANGRVVQTQTAALPHALVHVSIVCGCLFLSKSMLFSSRRQHCVWLALFAKLYQGPVFHLSEALPFDSAISFEPNTAEP